MTDTLSKIVFGSTRLPKAAPPVLLSWDDLPKKGIQYHRHYIRKMWVRGKFPKPVKLSERKLAWLESEIDQWISDKIRESNPTDVEGE